jgi:hypothetical protein
MHRTAFFSLLATVLLLGWADDFCLSAATPDPADDHLSSESEVYLPCPVQRNAPDVAPNPLPPDAPVARLHAPSPPAPRERVCSGHGPAAALPSAASSVYVLMSLQR